MASQMKHDRRRVVGQISVAFHDRFPTRIEGLSNMQHPEILRRCGGPVAVAGSPTSPENGGHKLTKLLLNVTIQRSLGAVKVIISPEKTVVDLIKAALDIYVKEKRRPLLSETDPQRFQIHYSQFSLESLNLTEKLINLGSRNFFLCSTPTNSGDSSCSDQAKKAASNSPCPFTIFMSYLL